jgi:hypothetical protein
MLGLNNEMYDIWRCISTQITRVHMGKIIPTPGYNHLSIISPCLDSCFMALFVYWRIIEQNSFDTQFKAIIFTDTVNTYCPTIQNIRESQIVNLFDQNIVNIVLSYTGHVGKKRNEKALLLIIDRTEKNLIEKITIFGPDIIIIDELHTDVKNKHCELYGAINMCLDNYRTLGYRNASPGTAVISFTKNIYQDIDDIAKKTSLVNSMIIYRTKNFYDMIAHKNLELRIDLIDDTTKNSPMTMMKKISNICRMNNGPLKKIIMIFDNSKDLVTFMQFYKKNYKAIDPVTKMSRFHNLIDVQPYNGCNKTQLANFCDLYSHRQSERFLKINDYAKLLKKSISGRGDPGILFVEASVITMPQNILLLENVDCVINFSLTLKKNIIAYRSIMYCFALISITDIRISLVECIEKNISAQLIRLHDIFFNRFTDNIEKYTDIINKIASKKITLMPEFTDNDKKKLEQALKITPADKKYHNRENIIYIVMIPKQRNESINQYFQIEKKYFRATVSRDKLRAEMKLITTTKSKKYSGPKWLSGADKLEIPGNKIGFVDEKNDHIKICEIIDVHKFGRRNKRSEWKEKENRDKNILFLSPVIGQMSLSKFKQGIGSKTIQYMKSIEIPKKP